MGSYTAASMQSRGPSCRSFLETSRLMFLTTIREMTMRRMTRRMTRGEEEPCYSFLFCWSV